MLSLLIVIVEPLVNMSKQRKRQKASSVYSLQ